MQDKYVDILLDYNTANENDFYFTSRYYESIRRILKPETLILGTKMVLQKGSRSHKRYWARYPEGSSDMMRFSGTEADLQSLGFRVSSKVVDSLRDAQKTFSFSCLEDGERLDSIFYRAKRNLCTP